MKSLPKSIMNRLHPKRSLASLGLLAAAAAPVLYFGAQIAAAPYYPGYSFSLLSESRSGTRFSRCPWIFNAGEILAGLATLAGAFGLYRSFRAETHFLVSGLIAFSAASARVMTLKAGLFPMPDPRHNSWGIAL